MPSSEEVDLVNEKDVVVGSSTIGECLSKGLLHRAVAVLVVRSSGRFLLQRRNTKDLWHPGLWTISSTGHVKKGESYAAAAARELSEELGIASGLRFAKKYLLPPIRSSGLTEREWVTLFVARSDAPCTIDPVELDSVEEIEEERLLKLMAGDSMTPDAVIILKDFLASHES